MRLSSSISALCSTLASGANWVEISRVRETARFNRSDVARMSDPHAEMSTAGGIIAESTEIALAKLVIELKSILRPSRGARVAETYSALRGSDRVTAFNDTSTNTNHGRQEDRRVGPEKRGQGCKSQCQEGV